MNDPLRKQSSRASDGASSRAAGTSAGIAVAALSTPAYGFTVSCDASLFEGTGAGHELHINKGASGDTASVVFETDFSAHAELGLIGDDDLHVKVSDDGSTWHEAMTIDRTSGNVLLPGNKLTIEDGLIELHGQRSETLSPVLRYVTGSADPSPVNFNLSPQAVQYTGSGAGGETYWNETIHLGWNFKHAVREDSSKSGFGLSFEDKFFQNDKYMHEWHLQQETAAGKQRRYLYALLPHDGDTGSVFRMAFGAVNLCDMDHDVSGNPVNTQVVKFDMPAKSISLYGGTKIFQTTNNVATIAQLNAAGDNYISLLKLNQYDEFEYGGAPILHAATANARLSAAFFGSYSVPANCAMFSANLTNTLTGAAMAYQAAGSCSTGIFNYLQQNNSTSANAHAYDCRLVLGANAGDCFTRDVVNGITSWSHGLDNSDGDKFKVSNADVLGTNDRLILDTSGNVGINGMSMGGAAKALFIADATTIPTSNPSGGGVLFVEGGALKWRGSSGTVTTLAAA